jgi:hypothetical protein
VLPTSTYKHQHAMGWEYVCIETVSLLHFYLSWTPALPDLTTATKQLLPLL